MYVRVGGTAWRNPPNLTTRSRPIYVAMSRRKMENSFVLSCDDNDNVTHIAESYRKKQKHQHNFTKQANPSSTRRRNEFFRNRWRSSAVSARVRLRQSGHKKNKLMTFFLIQFFFLLSQCVFALIAGRRLKGEKGLQRKTSARLKIANGKSDLRCEKFRSKSFRATFFTAG